MTNTIYRVAVVWMVCAGLAAQPRSAPALCPTLLGTYPVDFKIDEPLKQRPRFEIRSCSDGGGSIQLLGFKAHANTPSLVEPGSHVELLIQTGTLIVVQMTAGSSSPTLVAQFQKGLPVLLGREDGVGGVTYSEDHKDSDYAIITIPQKTFPDAYGKFPEVPPHRYRLKIWEH
jgi:hypothetical protein